MSSHKKQTPAPTNFSRLLNIDVVDQQFITLSKLISFILFIGLFTVVPELLKRYWNYFIDLATWIAHKQSQILHKQSSISFWMFVVVGFTANTLSILVNNLFMAFVYFSRWDWFEKFRISPNKPWPWQKDPQWNRKFYKTVLVVLFNSIVISFVFTYAQSMLHDAQYKYTLQDWPSVGRMFTHFMILFSYNQIVSYFAHRALHHPRLYWIHKQHHEYTVTISLTATYAHPLEYIFSNLLSSAVCIPILSMVTNLHLISVFIWIYFRLSETIEVHSGYEFPWGCIQFMPSRNKSAFHDFHHSHNVGTFGSILSIMDKIMGTDRQYNKYYAKDKQ